MTRPAVRLTLLLLLVAGLAVAAWQSYVLEKRRLDGMRQQQSLDALRTQVLHGLDDSRTAQQAYLAKGQGLDFWEARFAESMAGLTQGLAALRAQAEGQPVAIDALDAADRALKVYEGIDRKIRGFVVNGTDLMAADTVYEDGLKTATIVRTKVDEAYAALVGPTRVGDDQRRLQYVLAGTAAGAGLLVSLLLLPTGRRDEPAVELHAPESSLHLNERPARVDAPMAPASASDGLSLAPPPRAETPTPAAVTTPVAIPSQADARRVAGVVGDDALDATARVCTDLARVKDADELRDALGRAARLLDAAGVIVWVTDASGKSLKPLLTYGYPDEALRRIPTLPRESDNATAAAWRGAVTQVVDATETAPGAIAVPLLVPQGCVGVLAAEIRHGREAAAATRALAQIVAAQLAVLIPSEPSEG